MMISAYSLKARSLVAAGGGLQARWTSGSPATVASEAEGVGPDPLLTKKGWELRPATALESSNFYGDGKRCTKRNLRFSR